MLVLSRKTGEKVQIGADITLTVLDARGGRIKVGIDAPAQLRVLRAELDPPEQTRPRADRASRVSRARWAAQTGRLKCVACGD